MKAAIIGLPQSGKTTLFTAVTGQKRPAGEAPQEHQAIVPVPEARLDVLADLYRPKKVTYATIEFLDVPGFTIDDAHGQQELRKYLSTIRNADMLVLVVRDFKNPSVPAHRNRVDRAADLSEMREELIFADLEIVANRVEKLEKALTKPTKTHDQDKKELALLQRCREALEKSEPLSSVIATEDDARQVGSFAFLTEKPAVAVYNVDDDRAADQAADTPEHMHSALSICADIEAQLQDLEPDERAAFMEDLGLTSLGRDRLIQNCFDAMGLISMFTAGPTEVRAWPMPAGTSAVDAAGKIHTDLARGFIRAETVAYDDLTAAGDFKNAKAAGKVRQEGKTYIVKDGDVITIKFNV